MLGSQPLLVDKAASAAHGVIPLCAGCGSVHGYGYISALVNLNEIDCLIFAGDKIGVVVKGTRQDKAVGDVEGAPGEQDFAEAGADVEGACVGALPAAGRLGCVAVQDRTQCPWGDGLLRGGFDFHCCDDQTRGVVRLRAADIGPLIASRNLDVRASGDRRRDIKWHESVVIDVVTDECEMFVVCHACKRQAQRVLCRCVGVQNA